jgi:hypothetical protein
MMPVEDMVFVALNGRVLALDRDSGELLWQWNAPKAGSGFMTLLPNRDRLVVSAGGYIHCLDPATGEECWHNPLTGFGVGVAALATMQSHSSHGDLAAAASVDKRASGDCRQRRQVRNHPCFQFACRLVRRSKYSWERTGPRIRPGASPCYREQKGTSPSWLW